MTMTLTVVLLAVSVTVLVPWVSTAAVDTSAAASSTLVDPSWLFCFQSESPSACLQERAMRALDGLLPSDDKLPDGVTPEVARVIDRIGEMVVSQWYPEDHTSSAKAADSDSDSLDEARGHKKKVKKAIKKAILKLIIVGLLIKQKIKMLLMAAQTFLQFKFLLVATVYVISNIVKIWLDIKSKHHPQKVIYYENAHHQHHYEPEHHDFDDHEHSGGWGGLWGRSIAATATEATSPNHNHIHSNADSYPRSLDLDSNSAHNLVYRAHKP